MFNFYKDAVEPIYNLLYQIYLNYEFEFEQQIYSWENEGGRI